jgi:hypothetical protein
MVPGIEALHNSTADTSAQAIATTCDQKQVIMVGTMATLWVTLWKDLPYTRLSRNSEFATSKKHAARVILVLSFLLPSGASIRGAQWPLRRFAKQRGPM